MQPIYSHTPFPAKPVSLCQRCCVVQPQKLVTFVQILSQSVIRNGSKPPRVSGGLFDTLGVQPLLGRAIAPSDDLYGAPRTAVLSYSLWQTMFGGDSAALGRKLNLDGAPYVVIGVMPPEFRYPDQEVELWTLLQFQEADFAGRNDNYLEVMARLRPAT